MADSRDVQEIKQLAVLARLDLSDEQTQSFAQDLRRILSHIDTLKSCDVDEAQPALSSDQMPWRPDCARPSLCVEQALANAPERVKNLFGVPKIIE